MKNYFILATFLLFCLFSTVYAAANTFRILDLLPTLAYPYAIEPAIPENFVAINANVVPGRDPKIYWGPREVVEKFKDHWEDSDYLDTAIIAVSLSPMVTQSQIVDAKNSPKAMRGEIDRYIQARGKGMLNYYVLKKEPVHSSWEWGFYPGYNCELEVGNGKRYLAWVGLHAPEDMTLCFELITPLASPNKIELMMWQNFLRNTTAFRETELLKALGYDLQLGYTMASFDGMAAKISAERRKSDNMLQFTVYALDPDLEFRFLRTTEGYKTHLSEYPETIVKAVFAFAHKGDNTPTTIDKCLPIRVLDVDEFSTTYSFMETNRQVFVYQEKQAGLAN